MAPRRTRTIPPAGTNRARAPKTMTIAVAGLADGGSEPLRMVGDEPVDEESPKASAAHSEPRRVDSHLGQYLGGEEKVLDLQGCRIVVGCRFEHFAVAVASVGVDERDRKPRRG